MKLYFLTFASLLISLTAATPPILKFAGSGSLACPLTTQNTISSSVSQDVENEAENSGIVAQGAHQYNNRRQLRGNGEDGRDLTWCTNNGCYPNNPYQYCTIIGCPRRRELQSTGQQVGQSTSGQSTTDACTKLVATARTTFQTQAAQYKALNTAAGNACGILFSNITITCVQL
jgi:hypothetical protein